MLVKENNPFVIYDFQASCSLCNAVQYNKKQNSATLGITSLTWTGSSKEKYVKINLDYF